MIPGYQFAYFRCRGFCFGLSNGEVELGIVILHKMLNTNLNSKRLGDRSLIYRDVLEIVQIAMRTPPVVERTQLALYLW